MSIRARLPGPLRMVFQAMTTSLVSGLKDLGYEGWEEDTEG